MYCVGCEYNDTTVLFISTLSVDITTGKRHRLYGKLKYNAKSFGNLIVPSPVTGSHPFTAVKPGVPHPGLFPEVISFQAERKSEE